MPDVYTLEWYERMREAINARTAGLRGVPQGGWTAAVEIVGDGVSPYIPDGEELRFLVRIEDGFCVWYREVTGDEDGVDLDYRFRGPATSFEEVAAGILDPIDAALRGTIHIGGDMRFLMRHADLVKVLLEAYIRDVHTTWPMGSPPYGLEQASA